MLPYLRRASLLVELLLFMVFDMVHLSLVGVELERCMYHTSVVASLWVSFHIKVEILPSVCLPVCLFGVQRGEEAFWARQYNRGRPQR